MKIAVFYNLNFGGAKRAMYEQVIGLKKLGHQIDVYTVDPYKDIFDLSIAASNLYLFKYNQTEDKIPLLSRFINDFRTFYILPRLHKKIALQIDKGSYDIVLVHPDKITQAPFILKFLKTKSVYYCQEPLRIVYEYNLRAQKNIGILKYAYEQITRSIRKKIDLENVRCSTFTIGSCFHVRERMIEAYGIYPRVSYLGIDEKIFRPLNIKKKNQVYFVGNKDVINDGYDLANSAVNALPKKYNITLKCVSWVMENDQRLSDDDLVNEYSSSIAVICPNRLETFGLVPLEAMACGIPVIATNVSGHRETVLNNKTGYLTDFDYLEIRDRILDIIENPKDAYEMGKEGREWILKYWTWDKRLLEFEKLLNELVKLKE